MRFDLGIAHKWIYDVDFINMIEEIFHYFGKTTFLVSLHNVDEVYGLIERGELYFDNYLDRASDEDERFSALANLITRQETYIINQYDLIDNAIDKAKMHEKLLKAGVSVPPSIIFPTYETKPEIKISKASLNKLGSPFVIKPCYYSGGGDGVNTNAKDFNDIQVLRKEYYDDRIIAQQKIKAINLGEFKAWFRVFYSFENVIPFLWDDETHIYFEDNLHLVNQSIIDEIINISSTIAEITGMDYFSSEFALTEEGKLYIIDYVNDQCDMRLKSLHRDGVPDSAVRQFIHDMKDYLES
ncbi:MAG: hypothetical protein K9J12_08105 [Melioribacteraceae bacterium]|nr:hypothetical protein [Melioribacteraceae bacterium]MCF8266230.1 hypothetical protein [Melioribacteraceae bacterium]MCF8412588.1 hypothetical protein [Melioribacteraceae bacterium]MCF8431163.1 hypothetical protein [Melioribacteraceae bacterium]